MLPAPPSSPGEAKRAFLSALLASSNTVFPFVVKVCVGGGGAARRSGLVLGQPLGWLAGWVVVTAAAWLQQAPRCRALQAATASC